jgi:hypothetical protein
VQPVECLSESKNFVLAIDADEPLQLHHIHFLMKIIIKERWPYIHVVNFPSLVRRRTTGANTSS